MLEQANNRFEKELLSHKLTDAETEKVKQVRDTTAEVREQTLAQQEKEMRHAHRKQLELQMELNRVN